MLTATGFAGAQVVETDRRFCALATNFTEVRMLWRHRLGLAREAGVAPFVIASDRTLRDIARLRPRTLAELALAHGIGPHKVERYGEGLLRVVREAGGLLDERGPGRPADGLDAPPPPVL